MKIVSVVGARPQFIKLAPIHFAAEKLGVEHKVIHTGQHYDPAMSEELFGDLGLPAPDYNLEIGSGSHAIQTGKILMAIEPLLQAEKPDWVLVYGDTNSTVAAALAAVKLHIPVAHLEAGLRSGNRAMPEEHNRIATDHLADLLLAPTDSAVVHLQGEGLGARTELVGDVMVDVCWLTRGRTQDTPPRLPAAFTGIDEYIVATLHRAENTGAKERIEQLLDWLADQHVPVILLVHPRLLAKAQEFGLTLERPGIVLCEPLTYSQMVYAVSNAQGVITDSGGLQKEAFLLNSPCITLRTETEWPETVESGWNVLAPNPEGFDSKTFFQSARPPIIGLPFGDGGASERTIAALQANAKNRGAH
jgi:UDP-N-acetylglucosamine 2-epimerase (non-hydrolysing)